jgi:hypothetical protein
MAYREAKNVPLTVIYLTNLRIALTCILSCCYVAPLGGRKTSHLKRSRFFGTGAEDRPYYPFRLQPIVTDARFSFGRNLMFGKWEIYMAQDLSRARYREVVLQVQVCSSYLRPMLVKMTGNTKFTHTSLASCM